MHNSAVIGFSITQKQNNKVIGMQYINKLKLFNVIEVEKNR